MRINASQFGTPEDQVAEASAIVVLRPASSTTPAVPILQTPVVGIVKPAVAFSPVFRDGTAPQFTRQNLACLDGGTFAFKLRFAELALCALKTVDEERNRTGVAPESEIRLAKGEVIGRPVHICGTRLMVRFCIPSGVRVLVTPCDVDGWALDGAHGSPRAILVRSNATGEGEDFVQESISVELPIFGGTCQAVWEWVAPRTVPPAKRAVEFGVFLQVAGGPVGIGKASVNGCLAPISSAMGASFTAPLPRFVDNAAKRIAFEVVS